MATSSTPFVRRGKVDRFVRGRVCMVTVILAIFCVLSFSALASEEVLQDCAMKMLPLGSVRPEGRLRERLEAQAKGLTGHAEELYPDIGKSDWLTNAGVGGEYSWERGPYYARGLVALALTLDDDGLKAKAKKWVDAALDSQRADGDFGPRTNNWWANMLPLSYLRDWADATGDPRVQPFLERYFAYQLTRFDELPLGKESCWAQARGGDELAVVLWLYARTGEARWLAFARKIADVTSDWKDYYRNGGDPRDGGYRCHIVNFMQGLKFPALKWCLSGDESDRTAYAAAFAKDGWVWRQCGRPDSMVNGSEPLADRSASGGTELCAIAERIISCGIVLEALGDATVADDMEDVAYNALSATVLPNGKGLRYYLMLNQPMCVDKGLMFANNGFGGEVTGANCPGPHSGFGCCRSNWHVAWPKFVQAMWMAKDGGLAAVAHGPSSVTAKLRCGEVTLREETDYPFSGKMTVRVVKGSGRFPLYVRIPRWAKMTDAGKFRKFERDWKPGDSVTIDFPMTVEVSHWDRGAVAVRRGPLLYSLKIGEDWRKVEKYAVPYENRKIDSFGGDFPRWEIRPTTPWSYALALRSGQLVDAEVVGEGAEIRVKAAKTAYAGWGCMRAEAPGRAIDPPYSPMRRTDCDSVETACLIPVGLTQLHIVQFPWFEAASDGAEAERKNGMDNFLQDRIDRLAAKGGGTLVLKPGRYETGAVFFRPGVNLHLEEGAVIVGKDDATSYPRRMTRIEGESCDYYPALVNADGCDGFRITGAGTIDGHGANTWAEFWERLSEAQRRGEDFPNKALMRPRVLYVSNSKDVEVSGVTLKNSKFWTSHFYNCENVRISGCTFLADIMKGPDGSEIRGPSTDAIDVDKCRNVSISNCVISVNDDGVAIKGGKGAWADDSARHPENGPSENILVEDCIFKAPTHSCLTLGSECPAATNIVMRSCRVEGVDMLLNLKMRTDTPQHYHGVRIDNCDGWCNTVLSLKPWRQYAQMNRPIEELKSFVSDVQITNCHLQVQNVKAVIRDDRVYESSEIHIDASLKNVK